MIDLMILSISNYVGWTSFGLNVVAAVILVSALFPPFLDTKRSKKTFGVSASFFTNYVFGNLFMILNALFMVASKIVESKWNGESISAVALFGGVFLMINCLSIYMNLFILKTKKDNVKAAEELGISEREYYEKYLSREEKGEGIFK